MKIKNILKYTLLFALLIVLALLLILKLDTKSQKSSLNETIETDYTKDATLAGTLLKIEIAKTRAEQARGLSGRSELKENEGMLFVFDRPDKHKFWMKDMNFAIDMIWLDKDKKVVFIKRNTAPESYPELFGPNDDALYVLEVASGWSDRHSLKVGDTLLF
ncbi:MAG: DUF192 domain-containing protein [bacterium]|nr:DUF192 domain-containing protein [bacterium]